MLVGAEPAPSPFTKAFEPGAIPRIRSTPPIGRLENGSADWLDRLRRRPELRYVSDGDPTTITVPAGRRPAVAERYRRACAGAERRAPSRRRSRSRGCLQLLVDRLRGLRLRPARRCSSLCCFWNFRDRLYGLPAVDAVRGADLEAEDEHGLSGARLHGLPGSGGRSTARASAR